MTAPEARMARAGVPAIWGDVPARNKNFTGRDEILARLREGASSRVTAVLPERDPNNPIPQGVQGLGGVGKTAIAIEYAHRYRSDYDLVWWIPADQLPSVRGSLGALAQRLRVDAEPMAGLDGLITAVLDKLRRGEPYDRWLLIFDNADRPEDLNNLIPRGPGDVLITSRNPRWESVIATVSMDVFLRAESRDFLLKRVPRSLSEADADRLAKELGDLPLALEQAGAMLSETGMVADEYLRLLKEHVTEIMAEGKSLDYPHSMTAAWKMSVDVIREQRPQALELLRCCAFFGPEPIPRDVFRRGVQETGTPVAKALSDPIQSASAVRELARYALVTLDGNAIKVHRLIQALLRDELTEEQRSAYRNEAHLILAAAAPADPDDATTWPQFQDLLPHVNAESTELRRSRDPIVRDLVRGVIRYLYLSGDYRSALDLAERFIEQWTRDSGPDNEDVLRTQRHLGNIQRNLGRFPEAYKVTEDALAKSRATLGEDDPTTLSLRTGFAADLRARGSFAAARNLDAESRILLERTYGSDDSRTLRLLAGLALDHVLNSDYDEGRNLYEQAFRGMSRPSSGATVLDVLNAWVGIAWTLRLMGKFRESFDVSEDARDYGQELEEIGPEHLSTLRAVNAYLIVSRRLSDKREDALELGRATLELATRRYRDGHPDTLAIAISVSNLLRTIDTRHHPEALRLAETTVERYPAVYGEGHPYTHGCRTNLALLKRVTGDPATARELDEKALAGLDAGLGRDHHFTLVTAINLASDLAVLGHPDEARRIGEDTHPRLASLLGATHSLTLGCAANLALDIMATGDEDTGKELRDETLRLFAEAHGDVFPDLMVAARGDRLDPDFDPPSI
ncbi:MAG: tetratricopeptide repeat protein [Nocardiopsaceae bacterium]|nr:tetratricopeptide repeat protein [Nocardiopsaceae bacterium]